MYKKFFKRFIDFCSSLLLLPVVLIAIVIISPIIFLTDKGPIFYIAKRIGKKGKVFTMYKFRSMYVNSPDIRNEDGSTFNSEKDPRVTPIGKFIRKASIDEIPQLINVLIGDMSFVGPRPTIGEVNYEELAGYKKKRYDVRPGITGYSQAYYRNSISQDQKFKLDAYYVDNISFSMDIKVVYKTLISVLKHENVFVENNNIE